MKFEIMWKNVVERGRPQMTIWRMRIVCWIPKATNTHSEYEIIAFPLQQWLHERASMLRCTYVAGLIPAIYSCINNDEIKRGIISGGSRCCQSVCYTTK